VENDVVGAVAITLADSIAMQLVKENLQMREALKAARHALVTVHGLWATDGQPQQDPIKFQINTLKTIEQIEEALPDAR
jgi:hypothetical protein